MSALLVIILSIAIFLLLLALAVETFREFGRMGKDPKHFSGSDRLAGTGE